MPSDTNARAASESRWHKIAGELAAISAHRILLDGLGLTDCEIPLLAALDGIKFDRGNEGRPERLDRWCFSLD
jgi:hypothetical protein